MTRLACSFALLAALARCAPSRPPVRTVADSPAPVAVEATADASQLAVADATIDASPRDPLLALVDEITERMTRVRQLPLRRPIESGTLARQDIVANLRQRVAEEYRGDELTREGVLYRSIGLWNDPRDYTATTFDLLEEQVAGFYDPTRKRLFVAGWLSPFSQGPTLAHEITHALQDQSFDIARFTAHQRGAGDRQLAAMSVVEGDATLATIAFSAGTSGLAARARVMASAMQSGAGGGAQIESAPLYLRETLIFPYREGLRLCGDAFANGGWSAVNELLRAPPTSTEQVMHPDKLSAREAPMDVRVALPPSLASTHQIAYEETFGELGVQLWLRTWLSEDVAVEAAAGWGGDRAILLVARDVQTVTNATPVASIWRIAMDASPVDREALELERAVVGQLRARYPRARRTRVTGATHALATSATTVSLVAHRGAHVWVMDNVPAASAATVVSEALGAPP